VLFCRQAGSNHKIGGSAIKRIWACCLLLVAASASAEVPLKDFTRIDKFDEASISPDGAFVALRVPLEGQLGLAIIDIHTHKIVTSLSAARDRSISNY